MRKTFLLGFSLALASSLLVSGAEAAQGRKKALVTGLAIGAAGAAGAALLLGNNPAAAEPPPQRLAPEVGIQGAEEDDIIVERPRRSRYVPTCHIERKKVWLDEETYTYKKVEVCE